MDKKVGSEDGDEGHIVVEATVIVLQVGWTEQEESVIEQEVCELIEDLNPVHKWTLERLPIDHVDDLQGRHQHQDKDLHKQIVRCNNGDHSEGEAPDDKANVVEDTREPVCLQAIVERTVAFLELLVIPQREISDEEDSGNW